jgi:hypothetical protein
MSGTIQTHPYTKTYDEARRSLGRQEQYIELYKPLLSEQELQTNQKIVANLKEIISLIPEEYHLTKHQVKVQKEGK